MRDGVQQKLADPRLTAGSGSARPAGSKSAAAAKAKAEAAEKAKADADAEMAKLRAEIEADEAAEAEKARVARASAEQAKVEASRKAEERALESARLAGQRSVAEAKAKAREEAEAAAEAAAAERAARDAEDRAREMREMREKIEAEEKAKQEKRLEADARAKAKAAEAAQAAAAKTAEASRAAAAKARAELEEKLKAENDAKKNEADTRAARIDEELRRARDSMQKAYGADWGAPTRTNRAMSSGELGGPPPPGLLSAELGGGGGGGGAGALPSVSESGRTSIEMKYPPADGLSAGGKKRRKGGDGGGGGGGGGLLCGGNKQALKVVRDELESTRKELDEAKGHASKVEERCKKLQEKALATQEKAAKDIAAIRAEYDAPDDSLLPRLKAAEAEKANLLEQIEALLQTQHEAIAAANSARQAAALVGGSSSPNLRPPGVQTGSSLQMGGSLGSSGPSLYNLRQRADSNASSAVESSSGYDWPESPDVVGGGVTNSEEAKIAMRLRGKGVLRVKLRQANNLMSADTNGLSDPYVKLSAGGVTKKSKIVKKTLNPVWNEDLDLKGTLNDFVRQGAWLPLALGPARAPFGCLCGSLGFLSGCLAAALPPACRWLAVFPTK